MCICQCWREYLGFMVRVMTSCCINCECLWVIIDTISLYITLDITKTNKQKVSEHNEKSLIILVWKYKDQISIQSPTTHSNHVCNWNFKTQHRTVKRICFKIRYPWATSYEMYFFFSFNLYKMKIELLYGINTHILMGDNTHITSLLRRKEPNALPWYQLPNWMRPDGGRNSNLNERFVQDQVELSNTWKWYYPNT